MECRQQNVNRGDGPNPKSGLTLVEIMVVASLLSLLATIAVPSLMRARRSAQDTLFIVKLQALSDAYEAEAPLLLSSAYPVLDRRRPAAVGSGNFGGG